MASTAKSSERKDPASPYGLHRVLDPSVRLPQAADRIDNTLPIYSNEILLSAERLNIDAASFVQMEEETSHDIEKLKAIVLSNTRTRGKQQNRVTGSGGMLLGTVKQIGSRYRGPLKAKVGDKVATLVSLTLTPLQIDRVVGVFPKQHQIAVEGHAILFERSIAALMPSDLEESVALAAYDVAAAPAWAYGLAKPGMTVLVLGGGGKSGLLSCAAARFKMKRAGKIIAVEPNVKACDDLKYLGACNSILSLDATDPVQVMEAVAKQTRGKGADLVLVLTSVPNTENSALLSVTAKGKVVFFSMATSFSKVALGAEGVATTAQLLFGNGYYPGHSKFVIDLLRKNKRLLEIFRQRYSA